MTDAPGHAPRVCSQCGCADREVPTPDGEPTHWVVPELRWLRAAMKRADERRGWRERMWQGRRAMWRWTCRACLNRLAREEGVWNALRSEARRAEAGSGDSYWADLCEA